MPIVLTFILTALLLLGCSESKSPTQYTINGRTVAVANYSGGAGTLSLINLDDNTLQANVVGVGNTPNDMIYRNGKLYVINSISNDMNIFNISSNSTLSLQKTVSLSDSGGNSPQHFAIAGDKMYISNFVTDDVTVYNLNQNKITRQIPVGSGSADVKVVGNEVWVAVSQYNSDMFTFPDTGYIKIISPVTNSVVDSIAVATNPQFMAIDGQGRVHVVCTGNYLDKMGKIYIINPVDRQIVQTLDIGGTPAEIVISSSGSAFVAAGGWFGDGLIYRYNASTGEILNGFAKPILSHIGASRIVCTGGDTVMVSCSEWGGGQFVDQFVGTQRIASFEPGDGPGAMVLITER